MAVINTTNRITGMYSGIDTDSLIKSLMNIEQLKVDRQVRSLRTMEWKQEAYNSVSTDLKSFMNDFISVLGSNTMMKSGNYLTYKATVTGDMSSAVSIKTTSEAYAGTVKINSISQLAKAAAATSASGVSSGTELSETNTTALADLKFANKMQFEDGKISFKINNVEFSFNSSDSLQTVINTVNASDAGVNMTYSRLTDSFSFTQKTEGVNGEVFIENISGNAFGENSAFGINTGIHGGGQDAKLNINGVDVVRSSNNFTIDGINYTLNEEFAVEDGPVTIKVEQDTSVAVDNIKKFIEGYNTMIAKLTELTGTRKTVGQRNYTALTDAEKESMTEKQIEEWEKIAKTGLLYNDSGLSNMLSALRGALYETVSGLGISPAELGLRTGDYKNGGQITLDEDALKAALEKDPHGVMNAFMQISNSTDANTAYKESGLLHRINNLMNSYIKGSGATSLETLSSSIYRTTNKITDLETKMARLEEKYYAKYAALESAMSQLDSQSSWLSQMLGAKQ